MLRLYEEPYIQEIRDKRLKDVRLFIKREDVIHPHVSGNKWRKLKYNLIEAQRQGHHTLLTFGGAYSNHIYATASAAWEAGFKSIGVIRGEELKNKPLNPTLSFASEHGMQLEFVDRATYRHKTDIQFIDNLRKKFGSFYLIPEGGTNELALKGTAEIVDAEVKKFDFVCCSVGTGGTVAGVILGMGGIGKVLGFSALRGSFLTREVEDLIRLHGSRVYNNWQIIDNYHFGGYAKTSRELIDFITDFQERHNIPLEPIYTGKMMFGMFDLIMKGVIKPHTNVLIIHTGGLRTKNY